MLLLPNHNKPTDDHQKKSLSSFGLYNFLEVLCNIYGLLRVRRVGWQTPGSWSKCALQYYSTSSVGNVTCQQQPLSQGLPELCWLWWGEDGGVGWQPWAACDVVVPWGTSLTCTWHSRDTGTGSSRKTCEEELGLWEKLVEVSGKCSPEICTVSGDSGGLLKGHIVFCFTHGAAPRYASECMRKWGLTNPPFKVKTAQILSFWWSKGYLSWNSRYSSVTLLMKGTACTSFGRLGSDHSLTLSSSLLAIYGISLISQKN